MSSDRVLPDKKLFDILEQGFRQIENSAAIVGGFLMLAAMILTSTDALMRYLLNHPLSFAYYLTEKYLLVGFMTLPMAWGFREGGYIRLMLIAGLPKRIVAIIIRSGLLVSAIYIATLAWLSGRNFWHIYMRGDVQMGVIDWPVAWSWVWVPLGLGILSIRLLFSVFGKTGMSDMPNLGEEETLCR